MSVKELYDTSMKAWESFNINPIMPALRALNEGALEDVLNINGSRYYQFSTCLVDTLKPKQIVELGGAMGVWDLMVLNAHWHELDLYSITLAEHGLEFSYVVDKYSNFHPIVGDDLDMKNWEGIDLSKTDLCFFDSLHTGEQLRKELELYTPFFKKGAILLFDDIRLDELWPVWENLPYEKLEITNPCHYSGYGIAIV